MIYTKYINSKYMNSHVRDKEKKLKICETQLRIEAK